MHELKVIYVCRCAEGTKRYSGFGACVLNMHLYVKTCMHYLLHGREENFR
jgi:hypothetical protein